MRTAINAAVIRKKRILLVRKNETWILPGGKPYDGESDISCLTREIEEELPKTKLKTIYFYYNSFQGKSPHEGDVLEARVYFAEIKGNEKKTAMEISKSRWIYGKNSSKYKLSDITKKIINSLRKDNYL